MNSLAIAILGFRRHTYLKKCLEYFGQNVDLDGADFWLCQDGSVNPFSGERYAKDSEIASSIGTFQKSDLPNKNLYCQPHNVGSAAQVCWAFGNLFHAGYDFVVVMADDTWVNRFYVKTLLTISQQFKDDPHAGALRTGHLWFPGRRGRVQTYEEAKAAEALVDYIDCERLGDLGIWRRSWQAISSIMQGYCDVIQGYDFRQLAACKWDGLYPEFRPLVARMEEKYGSIHEDLVPDLALRNAGMGIMRTLAARCVHFGDRGTMGRLPIFYYRLGYDRLMLHDVGDVGQYFFPGDISEPVSQNVNLRMVYRGSDEAPFSIRGQASGRIYWRVRKGEPFDVMEKDIPFLEKHGFEREL